MRFQLEYQIKPSLTIRDYVVSAKTKKEADEELHKIYSGQSINIINIEKI